MHVYSLPPPAYPDIGAVLACLDDAHLYMLASAAIDILDERAGDCDLEEDDHSGDPLELFGEGWGDGSTILSAQPLYAIDQTKGPTNYAQVINLHIRREVGL